MQFPQDRVWVFSIEVRMRELHGSLGLSWQLLSSYKYTQERYYTKGQITFLDRVG